MIEVIKKRDGLLSAFVERSEILGLEFFDNYVSEWNNNKYSLKK